MPDIRIEEVTGADEKSRICETILRALPGWFGIEASIISYAREVRDLPLYTAVSDAGDTVGFAALKTHNACTAEIFVMGVLQRYHRGGAGSALIGRCLEECRKQDLLYLTVKTLDESRESAGYDKTRLFYHAMGFRPLEVFPLLWGSGNPCLFMVRPVNPAGEGE